MHTKNSISTPTRVASWLRRNYPLRAPEHGHCYLLALCGTENSAR